jgi:hypothetical protein
MTLPIAAVERLFDRLAMNYGSEFKNKWNGFPLVDVKTTWAHELSMFADNLNAIGWALQNLPEKCPNLVEFKNLCKQAPRPERMALEAPKAPLEVVDSEIAKIVTKLVSPEKSNTDHKRWAKVLKARHEKGEKLLDVQIKSYKKSLGLTKETA